MPHNDKIRLRNAPLPTPHREVVRTVLEAVYEDAVGKALRLLRKDRLIDEFRAFSLHLQHRNIDRPVAGPKELFQSMKTTHSVRIAVGFSGREFIIEFKDKYVTLSRLEIAIKAQWWCKQNDFVLTWGNEVITSHMMVERTREILGATIHLIYE